MSGHMRSAIIDIWSMPRRIRENLARHPALKPISTILKSILMQLWQVSLIRTEAGIAAAP